MSSHKHHEHLAKIKEAVVKRWKIKYYPTYRWMDRRR